ncbi:MAG: cytochrome P450 [Steroidobacteraceae bacterium]
MTDQQGDLPGGIKLTPLNPAYGENPYPTLKDLRERCPVHDDRQFGRWFVTRFDTIRQILRLKSASVVPRRTTARRVYSHEIMIANSANHRLFAFFTDDPEHRRLRRFVNSAFTINATEALRPRIRRTALALIADIRDPDFDVMRRFAEPLTTTVMADLLGVDPGDRLLFKELADAMTTTFYNPFRSAKKVKLATEAHRRFDEFMRKIIESRRAARREDLVSAMLRTDDAGAPPSDELLLWLCSSVLIAGRFTTADAIGNGIKALLDHPHELAKLRSRPELVGNAVEEILRYDAPTLQSFRIVTSDITVDGYQFRPGELVTASLAAANHDPAANADPDRFDVERPNIQHQSFGGGMHMCLGAPLARVELQEAITALLESFPGLHASTRGFTRRRIPGSRGMSEFWLSV